METFVVNVLRDQFLILALRVHCVYCFLLTEDTMSDITSLWRSDEKEYQRNGFSRSDLIFSANQFKVGAV